MAEGTHLSEAAPPLCTNSWRSSTASVTQAPLELAQRKEGMMHASLGSSFRDASIFQRKRCSFFERDREGRARRASLPPKQPRVYTATRCQAQAPCSHEALHGTGLTAQSSVCLGCDSALTPQPHIKPCPQKQSRRHLEITTNFPYQRSWC